VKISRVVKRLRRRIGRHSPKPVKFAYRALLKDPGGFADCVAFVRSGPQQWTKPMRRDFIRHVLRTTYHVESAHSESEILTFVRAVASLPPSVPGVIVEAGCFQGSGTAKLSWLAALTGRRLVVFDSFRGIPPNQEDHGRNIFGTPTKFREHEYAGSLETVKRHVARYGRPEVCEFVEGWFDDTLPHFREPVAAAYLDVDLASSTRTCLMHLYPLLSPGGVLMSQDAHLPLVIEVLEDDRFWREEVGAPRPHFEGLRSRKLVAARKASDVRVATA
jgi:O-methyltransferase